jgi:hypothetical protein
MQNMKYENTPEYSNILLAWFPKIGNKVAVCRTSEKATILVTDFE